MSVTIYGASDDLIEIEGDISEEFPYREDESNYVIVDGGAVFHIEYTNEGVWRITPTVPRASFSWSKIEAVSADDDNYSDRLTVEGDVAWVAHGIGFARVRGHG